MDWVSESKVLNINRSIKHVQRTNNPVNSKPRLIFQRISKIAIPYLNVMRNEHPVIDSIRVLITQAMDAVVATGRESPSIHCTHPHIVVVARCKSGVGCDRRSRP